MQLNKINQYISDYTSWLDTDDAEQRLHYWETQKYWQDNWDADDLDFVSIYDKCLQNLTTRRLWKREAYEPKRMILAFAATDPHFVHSMFMDLFNEDKDPHSRADRFVFYCDQMMSQYKENNPTTIDTGHYHDDGYEMISLYLSFQYPAKYAPYRADRLQDLLKNVGAAKLPLAGDFPRHVKVMRTLQNILNKDDALLTKHQQRLQAKHYPNESLLLVFDFACFVAGY